MGISDYGHSIHDPIPPKPLDQVWTKDEREAQILQRARSGPCQACNKSQTDRPAVFKGEPYCSDNCRKALEL